MFDEFWKLYPRHVAKKAAEKAWARVATSEALIEQIMAGLRAQLPQMITREKSFIPHASTWLNGRRWEDDHIAAKPYPRVIACEICGDTGVLMLPAFHDHTLLDSRTDYPPFEFLRCDCKAGQLPGVLAGVEESA